MMQPPQHSIDAAPELILPEDPAWDMDRIDRELAELQPDERSTHPYVQYQAGASRYDLNAPLTWSGGGGSAASYLTGEATRFSLRRLPPMAFAEVVDARRREYSREGEHSAFSSVWVLACRHGLSGINGPKLRVTQGERVSDLLLQTIIDKHGGLDAVVRIGLAAWRVSQPLTEAEGKP